MELCFFPNSANLGEQGLSANHAGCRVRLAVACLNVLNSSTQDAPVTEKPSKALYAALCSCRDRSSVVTHFVEKVNQSALHVKGT